jgi:hypothetical protein
MIRIDESTIKGGPSPALMERMGTLIEEMREKGVLLETAGLTPTSQGIRVHWHRKRLSTTDGPFAEAREVVGGYFLLKARDRTEAAEWMKRFVQAHEGEFDLTCEVREIEEG